MTIILYHSYYDSALSFLAKVLEEKRNLDSKKARLWEEVEEFNKQDHPIPGDILDNLSMQQEKIQLRDYGLAAQLFSCMTVEAFLNLYGVEYLGEDFYKRNLEEGVYFPVWMPINELPQHEKIFPVDVAKLVLNRKQTDGPRNRSLYSKRLNENNRFSR